MMLTMMMMVETFMMTGGIPGPKQDNACEVFIIGPFTQHSLLDRVHYTWTFIIAPLQPGTDDHFVLCTLGFLMQNVHFPHQTPSRAPHKNSKVVNAFHTMCPPIVCCIHSKSWSTNSADNFEFSAGRLSENTKTISLGTQKLTLVQCVTNKDQEALKSIAEKPQISH